MRFGRWNPINGHYSLKVSAFICGNGQRQRCLVGPCSPLHYSQADPTTAPGPPPDTWLWTGMDSSFPKATTSHKAFQALLFGGPAPEMGMVGFSDFPVEIQIWTKNWGVKMN